MHTLLHTVERLETALRTARERGFSVRYDWLGGRAGGACQLNGRKLLLLDHGTEPDEQLEIVLAALAEEARWLGDGDGSLGTDAAKPDAPPSASIPVHGDANRFIHRKSA